MEIGLIFPNKDRRYKTVHIGLAYLVAYARQIHDNLNFTVLDTRTANKRETKDFFSTKFDLIGITCFSPVYYEVIDIFNKIKKIDADVPICLGGPYVTTLEEDIFSKTPAEFAVIGEGEITFAQLISYLKSEIKIEEIDGLIYREPCGKITKNKPRGKIKDLDSIPFPAWDIYNMDRYPLHRVTASRGCPFSCVWCSSTAVWDYTHRQRSVDNVMAEIEELINKYGKKIFVFSDNTFNSNIKWLENFCDKLIEQKIDILWSVSFRADIINEKVAQKMKLSGCYNVSVGIESANNEILKNISKSANIDAFAKGIKVLKEANIEIMSQYVIGSPGETLDTVCESMEFAKKSGADYANFYMILPYRKTPMWDYVVKNGNLVTKDIHHFHSINPRIVFDTPEFSYSDRLKAIKIAKKNGFYSNQDKKNWMFDLAKDTGKKIQNLFPKEKGEKLYLFLKSVYRLNFIKKNNR